MYTHVFVLFLGGIILIYTSGFVLTCLLPGLCGLELLFFSVLRRAEPGEMYSAIWPWWKLDSGLQVKWAVPSSSAFLSAYVQRAEPGDKKKQGRRSTCSHLTKLFFSVSKLKDSSYSFRNRISWSLSAVQSNVTSYLSNLWADFNET